MPLSRLPSRFQGNISKPRLFKTKCLERSPNQYFGGNCQFLVLWTLKIHRIVDIEAPRRWTESHFAESQSNLCHCKSLCPVHASLSPSTSLSLFLSLSPTLSLTVSFSLSLWNSLSLLFSPILSHSLSLSSLPLPPHSLSLHCRLLSNDSLSLMFLSL